MMAIYDSRSDLRALHRVLVMTRFLALSSEEPAKDMKTVATIMDTAEYLVDIILRDDDRHEFRAHLEDLEHKYEGLRGLVKGFDE
jgi:hypothetical protein